MSEARVPTRPPLVAALQVGLALAAMVFVAFAIRGGSHSFSMVPFWDMWTGYLDFHNRLEAGDLGAWWDLHNEHRIVLARLLFWIDLNVFGGSVVSLVVENYLLAVAGLALFATIFREASPAEGRTAAVPAALFVAVLALFSWMQYENFVFPFQSQFFLAQLLPLLAYWLLHRSARGPEARGWFVAACVAGVLSIGTMASGLLAPVLLVVEGVLLGIPRRRIAVLAVLAAACAVAYLTGYHAPAGHGSVAQLRSYDPLLFARYVVLYLGSPFHWLSAAGALGLGQAMGAVLVALAAWKMVEVLRARPRRTLDLALLTFIAHVVVTGALTGVGRLVMGLEQATASRYTTPALMAWLAVLALWLPQLARASQRRPAWVLLAAALLGVPFFQHQERARVPQDAPLFERDVAALAAWLGIPDGTQMTTVVWDARLAVDVVRRMKAHPVGIFAQPWLTARGEAAVEPAQARPPCRGELLESLPVTEAPEWLRIEGWMVAGPDLPRQAGLPVRSADGAVAGRVLLGPAANESLAGPSARRFKGYVRRGSSQNAVAAGACALRLPALLEPPFRFVPYAESFARVNLHVGDIAEQRDWTGTDFDRSEMPGYRVFGSFRQADADTATVLLRVRRGDALWFRTGPQAEHQRYRIQRVAGGPILFEGKLPLARTWIAIAFDHAGLPDEFLLTLADEGRGWGEWSAIGLVSGSTSPK